MPHSLPPEVVVRIINCIRDRQTLCSCALVCRQWLPASRYNLFYRVALSRRSDFDLLTQVRHAPYIDAAFRNIHSLQLWEDKERPFIHLFPTIFSRHIPRMHFLTLGDFRWDCVPLHRSYYTIGAHFPSVTTLKLADGKFFDFADLRRVVSSFKQLVRLFLDNVQWRITPPPSPRQCRTPLPLPRLELLWFRSKREGAVPELVDWLLRTPSATSLDDVQIWDQYSDELPAIQRLTSTLGSQLAHFQVSLKCWTRDRYLDLSPNDGLRTLHVRDIDAASYGHLGCLLENISPAKLTELSLYLRIATLEELDSLRSLWPRISSILEQDSFRPLQVLTIWLAKVPPACDLPTPELVRELKSWMPALDSRCFLRVLPYLFLDSS